MLVWRAAAPPPPSPLPTTRQQPAKKRPSGNDARAVTGCTTSDIWSLHDLSLRNTTRSRPASGDPRQSVSFSTSLRVGPPR